MRNACQLLNAVAPSAITDFKDAGLEYLCLNLEAMLSNGYVFDLCTFGWYAYVTSSYLDELDEDLLHQLDAVVRDNQLTSMPFAKSGRAEALLHEKYPELVEILDRNRRTKIDSISLQAKFADQGGFTGTSFDPLSGDEYPTTPARSKGRSRASAPTTPMMNPQSPPGEVYNALTSNSTKPRQSSAAFNVLRSTFSLPSSSPADGSLPSRFEGNSTIEAFDMVQPAAQEEGVKSSPITAETSTSFATSSLTPSPATKPWGSTPLPSTKLGIQEIMQQASSRTSNISLGLASQANSEERALGLKGAKISQKERRKQQQQSSQLRSSSPASPASPWQSAGSRSKSNIKEAASMQKITPSPTPPPAERSGTTTPQLTLRQTVANVPTMGKQAGAISSNPQAHTMPAPQRSVSMPQVARPGLLQSTPSGSASKPIQVQSVRHTPRSPHDTSPTFYMHQSMADILSQQQAEKYAVKEAVAKRSLQEIQQEQEFLSWWDQESKRAMEEEAQAAGRSNERGRGGGRGRGGLGRGRERSSRRGKGKEKPVAPSA